ncbi:Imidazole glycerol phosphate synthase subunit HisH [Gossypium arboreum]|uniref:Imidazole glycerol phosphate synthase subunit HisH n=2 Tax=Gossypium arboreum TaxID=29729 RepID=A0A0B0PP27_GOSAR|nr:uncharacterized protein LOC108454656 [Gossypium arboreum]KAK5803700.1 hypothetical protein PVK06_031349 [Gossypium arboreum]KHG25166.1 Imidazole glycerol phosphate synthase subunit HisH [Gossypium arboreum]
MTKKKEEPGNQMDAANDHGFNIKNIMKDIQFLGSSHMTWKERKEIENRKVVSLGGKPPKRQRLPLSVAKAVMKNQKKREEKMLQENMILGRFRGKLGGGSGTKGSTDKRRPEDRVLKSSEGHFKNGVLDVKHLFHKSPAKDNDFDGHPFNKGKKKKGSGKKNGGKKKGGGRGGKKRH